VKFRVKVYGALAGQKGYSPLVDLVYEGTPISWTPEGYVQVESVRIEPIDPAPVPGYPGYSESITVCESPAMGGSPLCSLPRGHDGSHAYIEVDDTGKTHKYTWGKPKLSDPEARLTKALEVLRYVADVYRSPLVREAIKTLTAEEFVP